ncbi:pre-mRNA-splicing factor SPF27-like [Acropora millepora]|uniref:pre-mRNA-splicing factor SPF27-like n=1 Tax=Acropora millepora TaxID=45264 RepID=UPI001CF44642|nr:pre-mRNA-splicing factor SPF27-like [Acropora millepora]
MAAVHEVAPDALPYFDEGYDDPGVREMVNQLVEEETRRYRPARNYLDFLPTPDYDAFETKAGGELQHLEQSWVGLVSKNYEIERACAELEAEMERLKQQQQQPDR